MSKYLHSFLLYILKILRREAQAKRGEEAEVDPDQFQDPDNEYGLFAGTTYEQDDEEADKIYDQVDENMDARRRARRCVLPGQLKWSFSYSTRFHPFIYSGRRASRLRWRDIARSGRRYSSSLRT